MASQDRLQLSEERIRSLQIMANRLRRHSLTSTSEAGSGHPTTCFSAAELVSVLFFQFLRFDLENPGNPANDRFVLSKGHAAPILWAVLAEAGAYSLDDLKDLRKIDSELEGHPTPRSRFVDVATGSLGQGLSNAVGMAFASRINKVENQIYTLLGDGESAEGAVWEAAAVAAHYGLSNLTAIIDVNRLGQSEATMYGHDLESYRRRFEAFGWHADVVDGHDVQAVATAYARALTEKERPTAIIARTLKGKGVSFLEDKDGFHGKPVTDPDQLKQALQEIGGKEELPEPLELAKPEAASTPPEGRARGMGAPAYSREDRVATRQAYGAALARLGQVDPRVVVLDGDVKNSTYSEKFLEEFPDRFIESYIAEQNMVGMAAGLSASGKIAFASSFACFLTRAYDFIRMASISRANLKLCGSHAGVSIGEDGPSQMGLEDISMMRAVNGSTVLYPGDAVSAEAMVRLAAETPGIVYIRTSRPKTPILYDNDEEFWVGGSKTLRKSTQDRVTVISAGVTLHEALEAYDELAAEGIYIRVIDLYSVKPIDKETISAAALETDRLITVEDHYLEGGLGEAVRGALQRGQCTCRHLAVTSLPRSGPSDELLDQAGISARRIVQAVRELLS